MLWRTACYVSDTDKVSDVVCETSETENNNASDFSPISLDQTDQKYCYLMCQEAISGVQEEIARLEKEIGVAREKEKYLMQLRDKFVYT